METTIVTGFSEKGFEEYGRLFIDTFAQHRHPGHSLLLYTDGVQEIKGASIEQLEQGSIQGLTEFLSRWGSAQRVAGKAPVPKWSEKERKNGYSYRFDALKFCKMVYTMWAAAHRLAKEKTEYMVWLDGDTVVRKDIPKNLAEWALPAGYDYAYLGREPKHTETGFLVFCLPEALPILDAWADFYASDAFTSQKEWHSAFLFDRAREKLPEIKGFNLTPGGRGHVIHQCWVGSIFDHCKGNRKTKGRSPEARQS